MKNRDKTPRYRMPSFKPVLPDPEKYIPKRYTKFGQTEPMKVLSLKLDDDIYEETERITSRLKIARNRYINEAVNLYNVFNNRRLLKKRLEKESRESSVDSMEVLREFESWMDGA